MTEANQPLFDIIFRGDILPGHQLSGVKEKLAQLFKADDSKISALFAGGAVPLKRNLDQVTAEKYQKILRQAGADVQLAAAGQTRPKPAARPSREAAPATLRQRLAVQEAEREKREAERARLIAEQEEKPAFTLAPIGADLLEGQEKPALQPVQVDVSQMSLRPQEGDLVDASERFVVEPVAVRVEDFGLSELGEDLLQDFEKASLPVPDIQVPDVDIAPVGSDMGQLKDDTPPLTPDISGLSLKTD